MTDKILEHRKKNFAIKIELDRYGDPGERIISITHNGRQWQSLQLLPDEMRQLIEALEKELERAQ